MPLFVIGSRLEKLFLNRRDGKSVGDELSLGKFVFVVQRPCSVVSPLTCEYFDKFEIFDGYEGQKIQPTCKLSAAFRKLSRAFCDTCTSPLYINSNNAAMFSADVASRMTHTEPVANDGVSNKSAKFFEHAASMSLWALNIVPKI